MKTAEQYIKDMTFELRDKTHFFEPVHVLNVIKRIQAEAYAAGQKRGHEDAADHVAECLAVLGIQLGVGSIRELPIRRLPETQTAEGVG